jgi:hypothetical protein
MSVKNYTLTLVGVAVVFAGIVSNIVLTFSALGARNIGFWEYATTNKLGLSFIVWGYSPLGAIAVAVAIFGGFFLVRYATSDPANVLRRRRR